ncbi:MAG TPA: RNA polymerase sigma factor [Candidatus Binataceae bacterium]|nr:RNA polymerase sigma factor [Candidatus Binataceae bacterium]
MDAAPKLDLPPPFDEALRSHEREIMRFILRTTGDRDDALDLFQETWLRAYRSYQQLDSAAGLRPWLYRIASNLCLNRKRDRARRSRVIADDEIREERAGVSAAGHDDVLHLKAIIGRLPEKQRQALTMRKFGGLEYGEIATALGCSEEAARAGVYLALKKLKAAE